MAHCSFTLPEETIRKMSALGDKYDEVTKAVLKEGVTPLYDTAKANLSASIKNGTGDLLKSICTTKPFQDKNNDWNIKVGCEGVDRKGVSNAMKAAILEYGKSNQPAKPWLKPSVSKAKKACINKIQEALDIEVSKL